MEGDLDLVHISMAKRTELVLMSEEKCGEGEMLQLNIRTIRSF